MLEKDIPCGDRDERYPRSDFKKYQQSPLWDNLGKKNKVEPKRERYFQKPVTFNCVCGNTIKTNKLPVACCQCQTEIKAKKKR